MHSQKAIYGCFCVYICLGLCKYLKEKIYLLTYLWTGKSLPDQTFHGPLFPVDVNSYPLVQLYIYFICLDQ